jgi:hypothetical protein
MKELASEMDSPEGSFSLAQIGTNSRKCLRGYQHSRTIRFSSDTYNVNVYRLFTILNDGLQLSSPATLRARRHGAERTIAYCLLASSWTLLSGSRPGRFHDDDSSSVCRRQGLISVFSVSHLRIYSACIA